MNKPDINVTPLIDVLLVLLIIFMVITPTPSSSIEAAIPSEPKVQDDAAAPHPNVLVLKVNDDLSLSLNHIDDLGTVDETEKAAEYIREVIRIRTSNMALNENGAISRTVFVKAPRSVNYGSVAKVVDAARSAGARPVSLQIDMLDE